MRAHPNRVAALRSLRDHRRSLLSILAGTVALLAGASALSAAPPVVAVEEDWELQILKPDTSTNGPQITCVISPVENAQHLYAAFELNHRTQPGYAAGGMQLQVWRWEYLVRHQEAPADYGWDEQDQVVRPWSDGMREVNLFPQETGSPGNRGTVDIGSSNNSTSDIARQIVEGISPADLEHHGGELKLDENGEIFLNGDTGISAGVKDELASIIGQPRIIPVFRTVSGPGNNATYTIVQFVGIRVLAVKLTGKMSSKCVVIQPAAIITQGVIPSDTDGTSQLIYSPTYLVHQGPHIKVACDAQF